MGLSLGAVLTALIVLCLVAVSVYDVRFARFAVANYSRRFRFRRWLVWFPQVVGSLHFLAPTQLMQLALLTA